MVSRHKILYWISVTTLLTFIFILINLSLHGPTVKHPLPTCVNHEEYPTNSLFNPTKQSLAYEVNTDPACWIRNCHKRNNFLAYRSCSIRVATEWNNLGVISMERFLNGDMQNLPGYNKKSLEDAIWYFGNATKTDPSCSQANMNLGLSLMQSHNYEKALVYLNKVCFMKRQKFLISM